MCIRYVYQVCVSILGVKLCFQFLRGLQYEGLLSMSYYLYHKQYHSKLVNPAFDQIMCYTLRVTQGDIDSQNSATKTIGMTLSGELGQ